MEYAGTDVLHEDESMTDLEKFIACMEYEPGVARPNHELGAWAQTRARWQAEAPGALREYSWDWFTGERALGLDRREYIDVNFGFIPPFQEELIEEGDDYEIRRNEKGILTKALRAGTIDGQRMSMDQYLEFPVRTREDFSEIKKRLVAAIPERCPLGLDGKIAEWETREHPLVLGRNCAANGFYWRAREFMGTENLSYAWYDEPSMMQEMMEFFAEFIIETSRPILERVRIDYFTLNEDFAMKTGPLLSPDMFRRFVFPQLRRLVDFFRSYGTRYFAVDSDGDPTALIPLMMEAGVDTLWPIERAANADPREWRRRFGRGLRLWGGVDKRVLARGSDAIRRHLGELIPLIEEGGFIPTVDHTVPPDVSWDDFRTYMDFKRALLEGDFAALA